jgi:hypothetical protein
MNTSSANTIWKIDSFKSTPRGFVADVSTSKCKVAKKVVLDKLVGGLKGDNSEAFNYQLELEAPLSCAKILV